MEKCTVQAEVILFHALPVGNTDVNTSLESTNCYLYLLLYRDSAAIDYHWIKLHPKNIPLLSAACSQFDTYVDLIGGVLEANVLPEESVVRIKHNNKASLT